MSRCVRAHGALVLGLSVLVLGLAGCSFPGTAPPPSGRDPVVSPAPTGSTGARVGPARTGSPAATPACAELIERLSVAERVGQLLMVAVTSTGVTAEEARAVEATAAGSVLLLGNSTAGLESVREVVTTVRRTAAQPEGIEVMLAADQEGGLVQRLRGDGFDDIPAAVEQAEIADATLNRRAQGWGRQLARAGINADLAPVADVVPPDLVEVNEPVGRLRRGYGPDPQLVAAKVVAFVTGMDDAGVATAVKHFPGLGRVRGNTDTTSDVVDATTTRDDEALRGFRAAVDAGVDMVMVSSASYARIDPERRAVFSPVVLDGLLRGDLGFTGVVISDDLAAAALRDVPPGRRVARFLTAGGDLAIVGNPAEARTMAAALADRYGDDPAFAARLDASIGRVLALKQRRGLLRC